MEDNIKKLQKILTTESPILFLGAGFSLGAKTKNGKNMPNGNELKTILIKELLKMEETDEDFVEFNSSTLSKICQYYVDSYAKKGLNDFLADYFSDVKPADFHNLLTNYYWKKIYSTNIDDIVEQIYAKNNCEYTIQQSKTKNSVQKQKATEYLKLHGSVRNPSEGFVFSPEEYVETITTFDYRFSTLAIDMHSEHFIFVGSNFDDFNIDYYLKIYDNAGTPSAKGKLFFITPKPTVFLKKKIENLQGTLIQWTAQEFLEFISKQKEEKIISNKYDLDKGLASHSFKNIKSIKDKIQKSNIQDYQSKLYFGDEPKFEDIYSEWDFVNQNLLDTFFKFEDTTKEYNYSIFSIVGKAYIGKSTFLKRLAVELDNKQFETFIFTGRDFNFYPFGQYISKSLNSNFALVIDNAGYNYRAIKYLVDMLPKDKYLTVITGARPYFHFRNRSNLVGMNFYEYEFEKFITTEYATNIVDKLTQKGLLGDLSKLPTKEERIKSICSNNDVMSSLFNITYGSGFRKRLNKDLIPLLENNDEIREILIAIAIFSRIELPYFPIEIINQLTNNKANRVREKIETFIKYSDEKNVLLRNAFLEETIFKNVDKAKVISVIKRILLSISSLVDNSGHTYWNEIHAGLIKEKLLRQKLKLSSSDIQNLLYQIRNYYSDNFNYWIQLGISEQREKEFEKSLNHFKVAESLRPNSYMVQTSIGNNFLKQANSFSNYNIAKSYFQEGESRLKKLIAEKEEFQVRAYATHCLLFEKIKFYDNFKLEISNREILQMHNQLEVILSKDDNDMMAKHINNEFYQFLKRRNKTNVIRIKMQDLSKLKYYFSDNKIDEDTLADEFELE